MSCRRRARSLVALGVALAAGVLPACTSPADQFCGGLRDNYLLTDLRRAIGQNDQRRITEGLEELRQLQDVAPTEIHDDFRTLTDAVSDAVRAVTKAPGADGEEVPVDLLLLSQQLAEVQEPAQHVAEFADRKCGLQLNP